ncbi:hypothetical protein Y032_0392g587 [Ancylostoma ceylanicum]|nr:hypothetical protein Y032_0392g587 [Ancylostoma ceylanicum]
MEKSMRQACLQELNIKVADVPNTYALQSTNSEFIAEVHRVLADPDLPRRQIQQGIVEAKHRMFNVGYLKGGKKST